MHTEASHSQLMDRIYRHQRHVYDASRKYYLLGRDALIDRLAPPEHGSVLELGCGTGRNLIVTAQKYPACELHGIDVSLEMLKTAGASVVRHNLQSRIRLAQCDATTFRPEKVFGVRGFDRVMLSYSLSMMSVWQEAVEHALALTKPGGSVHIVDFGQGEDLPRLFRTALFKWLSMFHVTPRADLHGWLRNLASLNGCSLAWASLHGGYCIHAVLTKPQQH